jgi:segregation and condensation protein B
MRAAKAEQPFDRELAALPAEMRWREWMGRIEAAIFAAAAPVPREVLARLVGTSCVLDELIADIRDELKARPYDLVQVAGGWQHRTRSRFADAVHLAQGLRDSEPRQTPALSPTEGLALAAIALNQPVTRERISRMLGRDVSRDIIARLKRFGLVGAGPRMPQPGAPLTYVTTPAFLERFGLDTLRDLPDIAAADASDLPGLEPSDDGLPFSPFGDANDEPADSRDD